MVFVHLFNLERLIHYQCGYCRHCWAIGDGPDEGRLTCPRCGAVGILEAADDRSMGG